jgi:hypothetical protein
VRLDLLAAWVAESPYSVRLLIRQKTSWTILGLPPYRDRVEDSWSRKTIVRRDPNSSTMPPKSGQHNGIQQDESPEDPQSDRGGERKRFVKRYRTEVAASIGSILSTFTAVSTGQTSI